jgi:hypothetical protein
MHSATVRIPVGSSELPHRSPYKKRTVQDVRCVESEPAMVFAAYIANASVAKFN